MFSLPLFVYISNRNRYIIIVIVFVIALIFTVYYQFILSNHHYTLHVLNAKLSQFNDINLLQFHKNGSSISCITIDIGWIYIGWGLSARLVVNFKSNKRNTIGKNFEIGKYKHFHVFTSKRWTCMAYLRCTSTAHPSGNVPYREYS